MPIFLFSCSLTEFKLLSVDAESLQALVHWLAPVARGQHQAVGVRAGVPVGRQALHPQQLVRRGRRQQRRRRLPFASNTNFLDLYELEFVSALTCWWFLLTSWWGRCRRRGATRGRRWCPRSECARSARKSACSAPGWSPTSRKVQNSSHLKLILDVMCKNVLRLKAFESVFI